MGICHQAVMPDSAQSAIARAIRDANAGDRPSRSRSFDAQPLPVQSRPRSGAGERPTRFFAHAEAQNIPLSCLRLGRLGVDLAPNRYACEGEFFLNYAISDAISSIAKGAWSSGASAPRR
jgi:hypothetical protein